MMSIAQMIALRNTSFESHGRVLVRSSTRIKFLPLNDLLAMYVFLNLLKESVLFALNALVVNKLRTFLSLLGITIGIFSIISIFTVFDSMEHFVRKSTAKLGDNIIYVGKWPWTFDDPGYPWWKFWNRPVVSYREMEQVKKRSRTAEAVCLVADHGDKTVKYLNNHVENVTLKGVSHEFNRITSFEIAQGRYFSEIESTSGRGVALIGANIAEALFPMQDPLGKKIVVAQNKMEVIGIFNKEGSSILGTSQDESVVVPVNFAKRIMDIRSDAANPYIGVKAKPGISNDELKDELRGIMRSLRRLHPIEEDNFVLNEASMLTNLFDTTFKLFGMIGWVIGGFSILVGGFGIANIMFVSVKERTNIIGIQKSLGAKNAFVLFQFLAESVILSLLGGITGLLVIYAGTLIARNVFEEFQLILTWGNIALGLWVSAAIGIVAGVIPAYTASRLDPVEAIRAN